MVILLLRNIHQYYYRFTAVFSLSLFYPLLYFYSRHPERYTTLNKLRRVCCLLSSAMSGMFFRIKHEEPIDWSRIYIICPNHTSSLDVLSMCITVKGDYHFISKEDLLNNPFTGLFLRTVDIAVNRDSKMSGYRAYKQMTENLRNGRSLIIFPEGKIGDDFPPVLHQFKDGPFRLAIELKIPIIPITSLNTWKVMWDSGHKFGSRPGICDIYVHKPIETAHLCIDDAGRLKAEVYNIINKKYNEDR
jgi:1-acyl-sn-glycerol-3-phosphate acyltransferase